MTSFYPQLESMGRQAEREGREPRSFAQVAESFIEWQEEGLEGEQSNPSRRAIQETFAVTEKAPNRPDQFRQLLNFIIARTKGDEAVALRAKLRSTQGDSVTPIEKISPEEVIDHLLAGKYDKMLKERGIASPGDARTLAVSLLEEMTGDSAEERERMVAKLAQLLPYNERPDIRDIDYGGLEAEPNLADLCQRIIESRQLGEDMRERAKTLLETDPYLASTRGNVVQANLERLGIKEK